MKKITLLVLVLLTMVSKGYAQFPQGFEDATFPPAGWTSFIGANGLGTAQNWKATTAAANISSGAQAAFVRYEANTGGLNEDWLVTPAFTVTAPNVLLAFYERQQYTADYGTEYTIRVSTTSQTDIASYTIVDTKSETDLPLVMTQRAVDLSAYAGQTIYVAFVMAQDDGDNWAIDDVSLESNVTAPGCAMMTAPADLATDVAVGTPVTFTWDAPTTGDAPASYDFYAGTTTPLTAADLVGNFTTASVDLTVPNFSTTYYWQVIPKNLGGQPTGCAEFSFTTQSPPGYCLVAPSGQYPSTTYTTSVCDGATVEDITTAGYAGEYSLVNVTAGLTYTFSSSLSTDFITISADDGLTAAAYGVTPVSYTPTADGVVRFYTHADDQCTANTDLRTRSVMCSGLTIGVPDCVTLLTPADGTVDMPVGPPVTFSWEAATTGYPADSYDFYGGTALPLTTADLVGNFTGTSVDLTVPSFSTTFYWAVVPRNLAGEGAGCLDTVFSFTTQAPPGYCLVAPNGQYPSTTFTNSVCDGVTAEDATPSGDGYAGEYSVVSVIGGNTYTFSSSISTDFITISADGGVTAVAYGITPVTWTAVADGEVNFYTHADDQCTDNTDLRNRSVICSDGLATPTFATSNFRVYPNPVKDVLNFNAETSISKVQVTNLLGQEMVAKSINANQGSIDLSNLATGSYMVKLTSESGVKTIKVIKQ
jgi:hypothetical protein